jgi:hypothetical protein
LLLNLQQALEVANSLDNNDGDNSKKDFTVEEGYVLGGVIALFLLLLIMSGCCRCLQSQ